jgi:hypothetical protein
VERAPVLVLILFAVAQASSTAAAATLPTELQAPYESFLSASAGDKPDACDRLIDAYLPMLRAGKDAPVVDQAIVGFLSPENRSNVAARMAIDGIFSSLQEACIARNDAETPGSSVAVMAGSAKDLYFGLKKLTDKKKRAVSEWAEIARGLRSGWRYFPSPQYADTMETAFRQAKDKRGLFEIKAYRYIDESDNNLFRYAGLFLRWIFLPGKKGFNEEIAAVKQTIKTDILRTSPVATGLPVFGADAYTDASGEIHVLSFTDSTSELFGKRTVFAFFQTTCSYCIAELGALGRIYPGYLKKSGGQLAVVGLKLETGLPAALAALGFLEKRLALPFPLLENAMSEMPAAYRVRAVPLLIFVDQHGVPLWTIAFRGQGHIEEKLSWFLDDFLATGASKEPGGK